MQQQNLLLVELCAVNETKTHESPGGNLPSVEDETADLDTTLGIKGVSSKETPIITSICDTNSCVCGT